MKTTTTKKINVSRAINDAVKLCKLAKKIDNAKTIRASLKAAEPANKFADAMRERYGKKTVTIHTRTHNVRSPFHYRMTDITIHTGKGSNIIISERSRFRSAVI